MKHLFLLFLVCSVFTSAFAYDVLSENIYFNLNKDEKTATVTYKKIVPGQERKEYYHDIVIPTEIKVKGVKYQVVAIGDSAFYGCDDVDSVELPATITHIGKSAFENFRCKYGASFLAGYTRAITSIGERAFANSTIECSFASEKLMSIGKEAFLNAIVEKIIINDSIQRIEEAAFKGCKYLKDVEIADIKHWCEIDFATMYSNPLVMTHDLSLSNQKLNTLTVPNGVTTIKPHVFARTNITELFLPNSVQHIDRWSFYECENLKIIHLPASVQKINAGAFSGCYKVNIIFIDNPDIIIEENNFTIFSGYLIVAPGTAEKFMQNPLWSKCTILESDKLEQLTTLEKEQPES